MASTSTSATISASRAGNSSNSNNNKKSVVGRKNKDYKQVIAATAGVDNWKTWAGRTSGSDDFEVLDLFRGWQRKFKKQFVWKTPPAGTTCPVCFTAPETTESAWHVTSACGHAVCIDCFRLYAASQVNDANASTTFLKCPVCPMPLRPRDAVLALSHSDALVEQWDLKIRDEILRALPNYRPCPHCSSSASPSSTASTTFENPSTVNNNENEDNDTNYSAAAATTMTTDGRRRPLHGGGFVTPECLAPIHSHREALAQEILDKSNVMYAVGIVLFAVYVKILHPVAWAQQQESVKSKHFNFKDLMMTTSSSLSLTVYVDLFHFLFVASFILPRLVVWGRYQFAQAARSVLVQPVSVECPCCNKAFVLQAQAEFSSTTAPGRADADTALWMKSHTRPCPGCSVPISKESGCNHMVCTHCRAHFCWACMRLSRSCQAYKCVNGAPYGDANPFAEVSSALMAGNNNNRPRVNDIVTVMDRIARIEAQMERQERQRHDGRTRGRARMVDYLTALVWFATLVGRHSGLLQVIVAVTMMVVSFVFSTAFWLTLMLLVVITTRIQRPPPPPGALEEVVQQDHQQQQQPARRPRTVPRAQGNDGFWAAEMRNLFQGLLLPRNDDDEMLRTALARSLVER